MRRTAVPCGRPDRWFAGRPEGTLRLGYAARPLLGTAWRPGPLCFPASISDRSGWRATWLLTVKPGCAIFPQNGRQTMHISRNAFSTTILIIGLAGCAGRAPQPVALVQATDSLMDCTAISIEAQANNTKLQALGGEEADKVAQNVAAGVAR